MFKKLMEIFIECNDAFVQQENELIRSGVSERCLCGAFMLILIK